MKYKILNIQCPSFENQNFFIKFEKLKRKEYSFCKIQLFFKNKKIELIGQVYLKKTTKEWLLNAIDCNNNQISLILFFPKIKIINL